MRYWTRSYHSRQKKTARRQSGTNGCILSGTTKQKRKRKYLPVRLAPQIEVRIKSKHGTDTTNEKIRPKPKQAESINQTTRHDITSCLLVEALLDGNAARHHGRLLQGQHPRADEDDWEHAVQEEELLDAQPPPPLVFVEQQQPQHAADEAVLHTGGDAEGQGS